MRCSLTLHESIGVTIITAIDGLQRYPYPEADIESTNSRFSTEVLNALAVFSPSARFLPALCPSTEENASQYLQVLHFRRRGWSWFMQEVR